MTPGGRRLARSEPASSRERGHPPRVSPLPFAEGQPLPFAEGQPLPFAEGQPLPRARADGQPLPFAEDQPALEADVPRSAPRCRAETWG